MSARPQCGKECGKNGLRRHCRGISAMIYRQYALHSLRHNKLMVDMNLAIKGVRSGCADHQWCVPWELD